MSSSTINIQFGTSGYRGIIGDSFTIEEVRLIAQSVGIYLLDRCEDSQSPKITIGYDPRNGNSTDLEDGSFTKVIVDELMDLGIDVLFFDRYIPTPMISWTITNQGLDGGLILTASHNPPEYNGLKFNPRNGAPAPTSVTTVIQDIAQELISRSRSLPAASQKGVLTRLSSLDPFCDHILSLCHDLIGQNTVSFNDQTAVFVDAKHGTTGPVWDGILSRLGVSYSIRHLEPRSDFGGIETNPVQVSSLADLQSDIRSSKAASVMGFANDPDGDRHMILDENGDGLSPEETCAIIYDYLATHTDTPLLGLGTTIASSQLIKTVAKHCNCELDETAIGFKYFAPFFEKAKLSNKLALGVESSGGFSVSTHTYEKCGFLPGLLLLFISKVTNKSLSTLKSDLIAKYGSWTFVEDVFNYDGTKKQQLIDLFRTATNESLAPQFSGSISEVITLDGLKIVFDNTDWVLVRLSGTEPIARIYAESEDVSRARSLSEEATRLLSNTIH